MLPTHSFSRRKEHHGKQTAPGKTVSSDTHWCLNHCRSGCLTDWHSSLYVLQKCLKHVYMNKKSSKQVALHHFTSLQNNVRTEQKGVKSRRHSKQKAVCVCVHVQTCVFACSSKGTALSQKTTKHKGSRWGSCKREMSSSRTRHKERTCVCERAKTNNMSVFSCTDP